MKIAKGIELCKENGRLAVYCATCKSRLVATTDKVKALMESGKHEFVDSFCFVCGEKARIELQFGKKEYGGTE